MHASSELLRKAIKNAIRNEDPNKRTRPDLWEPPWSIRIPRTVGRPSLRSAASGAPKFRVEQMHKRKEIVSMAILHNRIAFVEFVPAFLHRI